jgi:hypothetical protein
VKDLQKIGEKKAAFLPTQIKDFGWGILRL